MARTCLALITSEEDKSKYFPEYLKSLKWLLSKRSKDGILISPHYGALLIAVLGTILEKYELSEEISEEFKNAIKTHFHYLRTEFYRGIEDDRLWRNEPWQIGLILLGLLKSGNLSCSLFDDFNFNEELEARLKIMWDDDSEWVDIVDTAGLTVGLASYLFERSEYLEKNDIDSNLINKENFPNFITFRKKFSGKIPSVFILYSRKDEHIAFRLGKALKERGVKVWRSENELLVGHDFESKIYEGIRNSDYLALIITRNSLKSKWVRKELNRARMREIENKEIIILPLLFEKCELLNKLRRR